MIQITTKTSEFFEYHQHNTILLHYSPHLLDLLFLLSILIMVSLT